MTDEHRDTTITLVQHIFVAIVSIKVTLWFLTFAEHRLNFVSKTQAKQKFPIPASKWLNHETRHGICFCIATPDPVWAGT
ncbi:MAG: hypothetical protein PHI11_14770 [Gallionella sp.]|nr:hypothetical protein [Gallionella sp.]